MSERFRMRLVEGAAEGTWAEEQVLGVDAGCVLAFHGTVRTRSRGREVMRLEYEAYEGMVEPELRRIAEEILERFEVLRIAVEHSVGLVGPGCRSVTVAVAAAHRKEVFAAAAAYMDELKVRAPLWKREVYADGSEWIGQGS